MNRKIKIAVISSASILSLALASATAYFSDRDQQSNQITVGINTIEIREDFDKDKEVKAGETLTKSPKVHVVEEPGAVDCYVRMSADWADTLAEDIASTAYFKGDEEFEINLDDWTPRQEDGYYYYLHKLSPGETTTPLFDSIVISEEATDEQISNVYDFDLICYAESVQAFDAENTRYFDIYDDAWRYWNEEKEGLD